MPSDFDTIAAAADSGDALAFVRERFSVPEDTVYLDGNSLGALPSVVAGHVTEVIERQWGTDLITSWNVHDWWGLPGRLGDRIGALIGAAAGQVMCGDSTSVQLFQALVAGCRLRPDRKVILTDGAGFPTDQYLADSVARLLGLDVVRLHPSQLADRLDGTVAVVSFSLVDYRTGELFDCAGITGAVHDAGAVMLWDLSHAAGAVPVQLDACGVDLAVGCTYKYLNGGPGSPAYLYVAKEHLASVDLPLTGWQGHASPFALDQSYTPADTVEQARIGTPPLLSMAALEAALTAFDGVSLTAVRRKSLALSRFAMDFADAELTRYGVEVASPREDAVRGSQVSLRMPAAYEVCQALIERGVIGDFRAPDLLRLGFTPLYLSHADVLAALRTLADVLATGFYREPRFAERNAVT